MTSVVERTKHTVVLTIARQMGSGGSSIGREVAARLDLLYLNRAVLSNAAAVLGIDERNLAPLDERRETFWERLAPPFILGIPGEAALSPAPLFAKPSDLFAAECRVMKDAAARHNAVIVGRGGVHVLRGHPGLISVFVHAPREVRIARIMDARRVSTPDEAAQTVTKSDRERAGFHKSWANHEWTDASQYHLCVDTGTIGLGEAIDLIARVVASRIALSAGKNDGG